MQTQAIPLYQVDAFTSQAFGGNPAAVCLLPRSVLPLSDTVRQRVAAEMNLSETAFLECLEGGGPQGEGESGEGDSTGSSGRGADDFRACSRFRLRWFTPSVEVPLCGHATLAAAAALLQGEGADPATPLRFETRSGELVVRADTVAGPPTSPPLLCMDFPAAGPTGEVPAGLEKGSPLIKAVVGDQEVEEVAYAASLRYLLVALRGGGELGRQALCSLRPDPRSLEAAYSGSELAGVIVTVQGGGGAAHDFYSRFFGPWLGVFEDPTTGSAHCVLGPYWAGRLGKTCLQAQQCSARGGELRVAVDAARGRVEVAGHAVLVLKGHLLLPREAQ